MESVELERLERIARNLPIVSPLEMGHADTDLGVVYMAWGRDGAGRYHGVWGCRGVARTVQFNDLATPETIKQLLMDDAYWFTKEQHKRGMLEKGFWKK